MIGFAIPFVEKTRGPRQHATTAGVLAAVNCLFKHNVGHILNHGMLIGNVFGAQVHSIPGKSG